MKRTLTMFAAGTAAVIATAVPAFAHVELQPATAPAGSTTKFNLFVEDEKSDAGTTKVELFFPTGVELTVAAADVPTGWKVTAQGGSIGSTATGLTWAGPALADSANLSVTLGPLPSDKGVLQFKVIQTYDNDEVDRWIGSAGEDNPGPTLQLLAAGETTTTGADEHSDGEHGHGSETTVAEHGHEPGSHDATTTGAPTATTVADNKDDSSSAPAIVGVIAAALVLGGGLFFAAKARKKP